MPQRTLEDSDVRAAMAHWLKAAEALDAAAEIGAELRDLLDLAEDKAMAGMTLAKRLNELGWSAPTATKAAT